MHDAEQMDRPRLDELRTALLGDLAGLHRQTEGILGVVAEVGEAGEAVQRLGLADPVAVGSRDDPGLERVPASAGRVQFLFLRRAFEQFPNGR